MTTRRLNSTKATNGEKRHAVDEVHDHEHTTTHNHTHDHDHEDHSHSHSHSHGIFGAFGHAHSREDASTAGAEKIVEALKGGSTSRRGSVHKSRCSHDIKLAGVDRGSQITLVGLYANIVLTGAKGLAGWYMVCSTTICLCDGSNFISR